MRQASAEPEEMHAPKAPNPDCPNADPWAGAVLGAPKALLCPKADFPKADAGAAGAPNALPEAGVLLPNALAVLLDAPKGFAPNALPPAVEPNAEAVLADPKAGLLLLPNGFAPNALPEVLACPKAELVDAPVVFLGD